MPRFFFHVLNGAELLRDPNGSDLPDLEDARAEALATALELWSEVLRSGGDPRPYSIAIEDEQHRVLEVVEFTATLDRLGRPVDPAPARARPRAEEGGRIA